MVARPWLIYGYHGLTMFFGFICGKTMVMVSVFPPLTSTRQQGESQAAFTCFQTAIQNFFIKQIQIQIKEGRV